jgi:3-phenylpropionate/cinnamic acid dioxygenase small subunit
VFLDGAPPTTGRDAIIAHFRASHATFDERGERPWHIVTNMLIESCDEERARVRCCYLFYTQSASGLRLHGLSRYHDDFVHHAGAWRIRTRRNVVSHLGSRHAAETGA